MGGTAPRLPPHAGERLRLAVAARVSRCAARTERALSKARDPAQQQESPQCRGRTRRNRARYAQTRCRCRGRGALEALMTTMHLVELATAKAAIGSDAA